MSLIYQEPTKQNGWSEVFKDKTMHVYGHKQSKGTVIFNKFTVMLEDVDLELLFDLFVDINKRHFWDYKNKETVVEKISRYSDVIRVQRKMPLFLSDRENIVYRCYIGNQKD